MTGEMIEVRREEGFAVVLFNRPERFNALLPEMLAAFEATMAGLDDDPAIDVVILTGVGKAFCAGLDVETLREHGSAPFAGFNPAQVISAWRGPVIAAINGVAATGGFEIAVACDIILAAESGRFVDTHSRVGLLPGWGLSARLQRAIGVYRAKELELTGRALPAQEAAEWGLVNRVVPDADLLDTARAVARLIMSGAPGIAAPTKAIIDGGSRLALQDALTFERDFSRRNRDLPGAAMRFDHVGAGHRRVD